MPQCAVEEGSVKKNKRPARCLVGRLSKMAPAAGFEPATNWLTANCDNAKTPMKPHVLTRQKKCVCYCVCFSLALLPPFGQNRSCCFKTLEKGTGYGLRNQARA